MTLLEVKAEAFEYDIANTRKAYERELKVSRRLAIVNAPAELSKKCFHCGLRNFAANARCTRCRYDVWQPTPEEIIEQKNKERLSAKARKFSRPKARTLIVAAVVLLSGLAFVYIRQDSQETPVVSKAAIVPTPAQPTSQPELVIAADGVQSLEAARHVLADLKRFQLATESSMSYEAYDEMLTRLKADLGKKLPSFVAHQPGDEFFRREVEAAVRDYSAAESWWKTVDRNAAVLTEVDKAVRLAGNWASARKHLENAEQMFSR